MEGGFGVAVPLLHWIVNYLKGRRQFTIVNGAKSDMLPVQYGIPQGDVLGLTLAFLPVYERPAMSCEVWIWQHVCRLNHGYWE